MIEASTPLDPAPSTNLAMPEDEPSRHDLILKAAIKEFAANGYSGASLQNVATRAGVAKGLIFHHFQNKKSLYCTALRRAYADLVIAVEPAIHQNAPFTEMVVASANAKLRFFAAHPESYHLIYSAFQHPEAAVAHEAQVIYQEQYLGAQQMLSEKIAELPIRPGVSHQEALVLILTVLDSAQHSLLQRFGDDPDALLCQAEKTNRAYLRQIELLFYGLLERNEIVANP